MAEQERNQRVSAAQSTTIGNFIFDRISSKDYPITKLLFGAEGSVTYVDASNPLPVTISGVATAANQATANGLLTTIDTDTGAIATAAASLDSKTPALGQALAAASVPVVLTAAQLSTLTPPAAITGFATLAEQQTQSTSLTTIIGHVNGVATAANQSTANGLLTTIDADTGAIATSAASLDSKTPALGQALAAASVPVVLTAAQLSTLTPPAAITGFATLAEQQTQSTSLTTLIGHVDGVESALTDAVTALQVMDDWDETNRCAVNLIVGQAGVAAGAGAVNTTTQRVTLASDDPAVTHLATVASLKKTIADAYTGSEPGVVLLARFGENPSLEPLELDESRQLKVALGAGATVTVDNVSAVSGGAIAHDGSGASGTNPLLVGGYALGSMAGITLVSAGDATRIHTGLDGVQITRPHSPLEDLVSGVAAITDGSSTSVIGAQGSGVKTYITAITVANTSATPVTVDIRDGAAGTVKWTLPVPADTSGVTMTFPTPLGFSANTAVCADPSAAASTVTISISGFKSKV